MTMTTEEKAKSETKRKARLKKRQNAKAKLNPYEIKVNDLIPFAEQEADRQVKNLVQRTEDITGRDGEVYKSDVWSKIFHLEMNRLKKEAGLIS